MRAYNKGITELDKRLFQNMVLLAINDIKVDAETLENHRKELLSIIGKNRVKGDYKKEKDELYKVEEKICNKKTAIKFFNSEWGQDVCEAIGFSASMIKEQLKKMGYM